MKPSHSLEGFAATAVSFFGKILRAFLVENEGIAETNFK
jgi:hypothetical protein